MEKLDELVDLDLRYVGRVIDELYRRLLERDYAPDDPEEVLLTAALTNILGHDNREDRPTAISNGWDDEPGQHCRPDDFDWH